MGGVRQSGWRSRGRDAARLVWRRRGYRRGSGVTRVRMGPSGGTGVRRAERQDHRQESKLEGMGFSSVEPTPVGGFNRWSEFGTVASDSAPDTERDEPPVRKRLAQRTSGGRRRRARGSSVNGPSVLLAWDLPAAIIGAMKRPDPRLSQWAKQRREARQETNTHEVFGRIDAATEEIFQGWGGLIARSEDNQTGARALELERPGRWSTAELRHRT